MLEGVNILYLGHDFCHNLSEVPVRKEIKDWQLILELSLFVTHCMSAPSCSSAWPGLTGEPPQSGQGGRGW